MIYVMRHGESVVNGENHVICRRRDGDLTATGREQSEKAARWLMNKGVTQIRHSPYDRAYQTAAIIGAVLDVVPVVDEGLSEMNCGNLEGRSDDTAWEIWAEVYRRWCLYEVDARFPGGESYGEAAQRVRQVLERCAQTTTLLITHGGIMRSVIPPLCIQSPALLRLERLVHTSLIVLEPCDADKYNCSAWNLIDHLSVP